MLKFVVGNRKEEAENRILEIQMSDKIIEK